MDWDARPDLAVRPPDERVFIPAEDRRPVRPQRFNRELGDCQAHDRLDGDVAGWDERLVQVARTKGRLPSGLDSSNGAVG